MTELSYTINALVTELAITPPPNYGRTVSGYGGKIPTRYTLRYRGRVRRVYVMQYGNAGSAYVIVNGTDTFLDSDTEHDLAALS